MIAVFHEIEGYPKSPITIRDSLDILYQPAVGRLAEIHLNYSEANQLIKDLEQFLLGIGKFDP
jgi:hypothetical protein